MIHTNLCLWTKETFRDIGNNLIVSLSFIFIIPIMIFVHLVRSFGILKLYGLQYCFADCFVITADVYFFALMIVPFSFFFISHILKHDFSIPFAVRQKSKKRMWMKQIYKTFLFSFLITTYVTIWNYVLGGFLTADYINWYSQDSVYYFVNKATTDQDLFFNVVLIYFLTRLIILFFIHLSAFLVEWLTNKKILSWVLIIAVGCWDIFNRQFPILYGRLSIDYKIWENPSIILVDLIYSICAILLILFAGMASAKRKEFLNE